MSDLVKVTHVAFYRCCFHCLTDRGDCSVKIDKDRHNEPCPVKVAGKKCRRGQKKRWYKI